MDCNKTEMQEQFYCTNKCCSIEVKQYDKGYVRRRKGRVNKAGIFLYDPEKKQVLLVQSRGQLWGIPKGTANIGESFVDCAIRETKEETGIIVEQSEFLKTVIIKDRQQYFFVHKKSCPVQVQDNEDTEKNDANAIGWIKIECLKKLIDQGNIILNNATKILFREFFKVSFPKSDFRRVKKRRRKRPKR